MQNNSLSLLMLASAMGSLFLALYIYMRRKYPAMFNLSLLLMAVTIWALGYSLELASTNLQPMKVFNTFAYLGIATIPVLWLIFVARYTGNDGWLTPLKTTLLFIVPAISIVLVATNDQHYLFYSLYEIDLFGGISFSSTEPGLFWWVHVTYSYLVIIAGLWLLISLYFKVPRPNRFLVGLFIAGLLLPYVANIAYVSGFKPYGFLDITPIAFIVMGLLLSFGAFTKRALDVSPLAYDLLFQNIPDIIFVIDTQGRIVNTNPAAKKFLEYELNSEVGGDNKTDLPATKQNLAALSDASELTLNDKIYTVSNTSILSPGSKTFGRLVVLHDVTTRRKAEESLRESEKKHRFLAENMGDIIWTLDLNFKTTFVSPSIKKILGFTPEERKLQTLSEVMTPESQARSMEMLQKELAREEDGSYDPERAATIEVEYYHHDGSTVWMENIMRALRDEEGRLIGVYGISRDISERKQAEKALRESELFLKETQAIAKLGGWKTNPRTDTLIWNDGVYDVIEEHRDYCPGLADGLRYYHSEYLPVLHSGLENCLAQGEPFSLEAEITTAKGNNRWVEVQAFARSDSDHETLVMGTIQDITERKQAEVALKASEEKYREILSTMQEGYYEVDLKGNFVFFNDSFCEAIGYSRDEILQGSYKILSKDPQELFNAYHRVYQTGQAEKAFGWTAIIKDGREIYVEVSIALRRNEAGEPIGFRGVARDVTERKEAEEKIRYLSFHDKVTGLYNRTFLEEEMKRLDTERQLPLAIIMADLNGLKLVNDTYGHKKGDEMLITAAEIIKNSCREEDIISRWGGDEFVILLPHTNSVEASLICKRITAGCQDAYIEDVPLSIALGTATKDVKNKDLMNTLREAEDEMYKNKLTESRSTKSALVTSLLNTLAEKSYETEIHTREMQMVAQQIGARLNLPDSELHRLELLITLHDIGKINISEAILTKEDSLTDDEWKEIVKHPEIGCRIAMATEEFAHVAEDILAHHERWDGSGYPQGLKGEAIPLLARITAIADAFEVMRNGRPYKKAMSISEIIAEFKNCSGAHFDPELVEVLLPILEG